MKKTVLIVPPNDAEAILISQIADKMELPMIASKQTHGASIDKGRDYVPLIKKGGYTRVVIVEMPGPKTEAHLKQLGFEVVVIDHHHYTGLDRAHDARGRMLPSSLEQFVRLFKLTPARLKKLGFDPHLVKAVGIMDRGYVWGLQDEGFSKKEISDVLAYQDSLLGSVRNPATEARKQRVAQQAWKRRKKWKGYLVIESRADVQLRPRLSRIVALQIGKPTALIVIERARGLIYVQESDHAMELFGRFGGFTFGLDRNWGYRNEKGKPKVWLKEVQSVLI